MPTRCPKFLVVLVAVAVMPSAWGYMEYQPATLAKLCKSPRIRLLKVTKFDKESGVVVFELVENLNTPDDKVKSEMADKIPTTKDDKVRTFKNSIPTEKDGKPVWEWVGKDKTAVMFTLENGGHEVSARACGYVFIDALCFSVVYNKAGDYWAFIRAEPQMSKCYSGKAAELPALVKAVLAGQEVKVPTKEPAADVEFKERAKQVFDALNKNK
jgi:hypothetical protein